MPTYKKGKERHMRIKGVPEDVHRAIIVHQKQLSFRKNTDVTIDEASIDLWREATREIRETLSKP